MDIFIMIFDPPTLWNCGQYLWPTLNLKFASLTLYRVNSKNKSTLLHILVKTWWRLSVYYTLIIKYCLWKVLWSWTFRSFDLPTHLTVTTIVWILYCGSGQWPSYPFWSMTTNVVFFFLGLPLTHIAVNQKWKFLSSSSSMLV